MGFSPKTPKNEWTVIAYHRNNILIGNIFYQMNFLYLPPPPLCFFVPKPCKGL